MSISIYIYIYIYIYTHTQTNVYTGWCESHYLKKKLITFLLICNLFCLCQSFNKDLGDLPWRFTRPSKEQKLFNFLLNFQTLKN